VLEVFPLPKLFLFLSTQNLFFFSFCDPKKKKLTIKKINKKMANVTPQRVFNNNNNNNNSPAAVSSSPFPVSTPTSSGHQHHHPHTTVAEAIVQKISRDLRSVANASCMVSEEQIRQRKLLRQQREEMLRQQQEQQEKQEKLPEQQTKSSSNLLHQNQNSSPQAPTPKRNESNANLENITNPSSRGDAAGVDVVAAEKQREESSDITAKSTQVHRKNDEQQVQSLAQRVAQFTNGIGPTQQQQIQQQAAAVQQQLQKKDLQQSQKSGESPTTPPNNNNNKNSNKDNAAQPKIPVVSRLQANAITNQELAKQLDIFQRQQKLIQEQQQKAVMQQQLLAAMKQQQQHLNGEDGNSTNNNGTATDNNKNGTSPTAAANAVTENFCYTGANSALSPALFLQQQQTSASSPGALGLFSPGKNQQLSAASKSLFDNTPFLNTETGRRLISVPDGQYVPIRRLGNGSFGEVFVVLWKPAVPAAVAVVGQEENGNNQQQPASTASNNNPNPLSAAAAATALLQKSSNSVATDVGKIPDATLTAEEQRRLRKKQHQQEIDAWQQAHYLSQNLNNNLSNGLQQQQQQQQQQQSAASSSPGGLVSGLSSTSPFVVGRTEDELLPRENVYVCKIEPEQTAKERIEEEKAGLRTDRGEKEEYVLANCAHPNIVGFVDEFTYHDRKHLVMEYCDGGDLKQEINRRAHGDVIRYIAEESVLFLAVQILLAMEYLHRHNILHRDLKSANILISKKWIVKLGDFGFAKHYNHDVDGNVDVSTLGTPYYIAPEVYRRKPYSEKAEMWAFGIILYEIVALCRPFREDDLTTIVRSIIYDHPKPIRRVNISLDLLRLMDSLLQKDPALRPTAKECLKMELFQKPLQHYLKRVAKISSDPKVGTELDKVWYRVLTSHVNTLFEDSLTSSKSRFRVSRSRSRSKEARSANSSRRGSTSSANSQKSKSNNSTKKSSGDDDDDE
jgi:serine/threonine protein kinase